MRRKQQFCNNKKRRTSSAPLLALISGLLLSASQLHAACPGQKLIAITKIKEKSTAFPASDIGYNEGTVTVSMPLEIAIGSAAINPTTTTFDADSRITVRKRLWRFMSRTAGLTTNNLKISYDINGDNKLRAAADPTSKIGVSILHRDIKVLNRRPFSLFDAYVDLVFDYSEARLAGQYTGFLTINVDCSL